MRRYAVIPAMNSSQSTGHRQAIVFAGKQAWCQQQAEAIAGQFARLEVCWLADVEHSLLGQEVDVLIVDARKGFDPDLFGQATGTIRGGGLLVLLTPDFDTWPAYNDPQNERVNVALYPPSSIQGHFIQRLTNVIRNDKSLVIVNEGEKLPAIDLPVEVLTDKRQDIRTTADQQQAIEAVIKVVTGQRRRPVVLTSDRGRGKSAAFGMAAAELLKSGCEHITVTGPSILSVDALFKHALKNLEGAHSKRGVLTWNSASIKFIAPDELVEGQHDTELLLVDEAAAIPAPMLQQLLAKFPRIAFATTVHGYEGTGRGFAIRFNQTLDTQTRGWKALTLKTPVRWAENDPVEQLVSDMLLLNAEAAPNEVISAAQPELCQVEKLDRATLIEDEAGLAELFGLLVIAHYRTRPFDLRHLLDGPNVSVYAMRYQGHVVATALVSKEGGFDAQSATQIRLGNTRPHGHLLPEILAAHLGLDQAPQLMCVRIMRIAVHPSVQQRGIGTALLRSIIDDSSKQNIDYIGSSFGATMSYCVSGDSWICSSQAQHQTRRNERRTFRCPDKRIKSGRYRILVSTARYRFEKHIFHQFADSIRNVDPDMAIQLLLYVDTQGYLQLDEADKQDLNDFATGHRLYETCLGPIHALVQFSICRASVLNKLSGQEQRLLVTRVLQHKDWQASAELSNLAGRKQAVEMLRQVVVKLIGDIE